MARIANVNIPDHKRIVISLTYIYGVGSTSAQKICDAIGIDRSLRVKNLTDDQLVQLRAFVEKNHRVEGELRREISLNIKKKKDIKSYQGLRHILSLPVHGQNTHSNARTRKGKAVPIAGKKKVTK